MYTLSLVKGHLWTCKSHAFSAPRVENLSASQRFQLLSQITVVFFAYFVTDGVVMENAFELAAALILDALVLGRIIFYIFKERTDLQGGSSC